MLSGQLEANRRAAYVKAALHGKRRHPGQIERGRVAQQMRDIALRHLRPLRGTGHWSIPYRDQQNIDVLKNLRDLTGEPVTQDMSLSQQEPDHLWIGNRATQKP